MAMNQVQGSGLETRHAPGPPTRQSGGFSLEDPRAGRSSRMRIELPSPEPIRVFPGEATRSCRFDHDPAVEQTLRLCLPPSTTSYVSQVRASGLMARSPGGLRAENCPGIRSTGQCGKVHGSDPAPWWTSVVAKA